MPDSLMLLRNVIIIMIYYTSKCNGLSIRCFYALIKGLQMYDSHMKYLDIITCSIKKVTVYMCSFEMLY